MNTRINAAILNESKIEPREAPIDNSYYLKTKDGWINLFDPKVIQLLKNLLEI